MVLTVWDVIIPAIIGIVASLAAPWANWRVEKRKKLLEWRRGFITKCNEIVNKSDFNPDIFRETSYYARLKPNLTNNLKREIEEKRYSPGVRMSLEQDMARVMKELRVKKNLLNEITLIERRWGLL